MKPRIKITSGLAIVFSLLIAVSCQADELSACTQFQWVTDFDGAKKAAMVVTASARGHSFDLQFDTGSDVSGFFGTGPFADLNVKTQKNAGGHTVASLPLSLNSLSLGTQEFYLLPQPPGRVVGRLGLKALLGNIIQIDYPQRKICRIDPTKFKTYRYDLKITPASIRSNKLFLFAELNGELRRGLFFDTGASLYNLLVDQEFWRALTGKQGHEANNHTMQGWSHNRLITTIGAPLKGQMTLGSLVINAPLIHYTRERPNYFTNYPIEAQGLIGNAPFFDKVVVLDLRTERAWFGVQRAD